MSSASVLEGYIIAPKVVGLHSTLPMLFPGCQLHEWHPRGVTKLSGSIRKALAIIDQWDGEGFGDEIALVEIADKIGMKRKDFRKQVAKDPRFKEEVRSRGYVEEDISCETTKGLRVAKGIVRHSVFPEDPSSSFQVADLD